MAGAGRPGEDAEARFAHVDGHRRGVAAHIGPVHLRHERVAQNVAIVVAARRRVVHQGVELDHDELVIRIIVGIDQRAELEVRVDAGAIAIRIEACAVVAAHIAVRQRTGEGGRGGSVRRGARYGTPARDGRDGRTAADVTPPAGSLETKAIFAVPSSRKVSPVGRLSWNWRLRGVLSGICHTSR